MVGCALSLCLYPVTVACYSRAESRAESRAWSMPDHVLNHARVKFGPVEDSNDMKTPGLRLPRRVVWPRLIHTSRVVRAQFPEPERVISKCKWCDQCVVA